MSKDVSIIVNCRNGSKFLDYCLSSIKNQNLRIGSFFDNCLIIVMNYIKSIKIKDFVTLNLIKF